MMDCKSHGLIHTIISKFGRHPQRRCSLDRTCIVIIWFLILLESIGARRFCFPFFLVLIEFPGEACVIFFVHDTLMFEL